MSVAVRVFAGTILREASQLPAVRRCPVGSMLIRLSRARISAWSTRHRDPPRALRDRCDRSARSDSGFSQPVAARCHQHAGFIQPGARRGV